MPGVDRFTDPWDLITELGIRGPEEIAVEAIAEFCGATVVYDRLYGCEASIVGRGDRAIITVDRGSPRARQRFSAAHELGHWLLDRGEAGFACSGEVFEVEWWDEDGPEGVDFSRAAGQRMGERAAVASEHAP